MADTQRALYRDLTEYIDIRQLECLNQQDNHTIRDLIDKNNAEGYLASDVDEQLSLYIAFLESVKIHSIEFVTKGENNTARPKTVLLYLNPTTTLDFDTAESTTPTQTLTLTFDEEGKAKLPLRFVKFQRVSSLGVFVKDNYGSEVTQIDAMVLYGELLEGTKMSELKAPEQPPQAEQPPQ